MDAFLKLIVKSLPANAGDTGSIYRSGRSSGVGNDNPQPTPVPLPGNFHGQSSLVGCSPWDR